MLHCGHQGDYLTLHCGHQGDYLMLHCGHQTDSAVSRAAVRPIFNVSVINSDGEKTHDKTVSIITTLEEKVQPKPNGTQVRLLTSLATAGQNRSIWREIHSCLFGF